MTDLEFYIANELKRGSRQHAIEMMILFVFVILPLSWILSGVWLVFHNESMVQKLTNEISQRDFQLEDLEMKVSHLSSFQ